MAKNTWSSQARVNPTAFMSLLAKVLSLQLDGDGGPLLLEQVTTIAMRARDKLRAEQQGPQAIIDVTPSQTEIGGNPRRAISTDQ